jgi:hypothetical protein
MSNSTRTNPQNLQRTSGIETETATVESRNDSVSALAALYQGEKTDASYVFNTAMAMMGIAVAYLVGAIQFMDKISQGPIAWLFLLLLPIPVWLIAAFHSLMTLNAMSHGISVRIIEQALFDLSELRVERDLVGSAAGDKIMDITKSAAAHKLVNVVVYGGVAFLVIGFTAYALYSANMIIKNDVLLVHARVIWIAIAIYSLIVIMVAFSWIEGFRIIKKGSALAESYPPWHLRRQPPPRLPGEIL